MYPLIDAATREFSDYIKARILSGEGLDVREISQRYSCDSMASTTYAVNAKAYNENTSELLHMSRKLSSSWQQITPDVNQFFIRLTSQSIQRRRYNNEQRNDILSSIIKLKDKMSFSDVETASHAMAFYFHGFEITSLALCYVLYEISRNKNVQEKLRMEIETVVADSRSSVPFETLITMPYLDQVFYESLRLHPPIPYTTRLCNKATELTDSRNKIDIPKGTALWIPIHSIHRDSQHYENPAEFIPERFDKDVKTFREKCVLLPFGDGGRICLGQNLGIVQVKAAVVELMRHFELICCESVTDEDVEIAPKEFFNVPRGKILVEFREISG